MKFLVATTNMGKLREFQALMPNHEFELLPEDYVAPEEDGSTFIENARIKARAALNGLPVLAEDSGLCVDALDGAPGIYSARYGGFATDEERNMHLLRQMVGKTNRNAHFECAVVCLFPDGREFVVTAQCAGTIVQVPRGTNGFGYDSVFERDGITTAEMSTEQKNKISHRGLAIRRLLEYEDCFIRRDV